ncbi:MAG: DUF2188 domain-containing protein [Saprospiraceae bacterium]
MSAKSSNLVKGRNRTALIRAIARSARTIEPRIHVIPSKGMWGIKFEGKHRLYRRFVRKDTAIRNAKALASAGDGSLLIIHGADGMVTGSISYQQ